MVRRRSATLTLLAAAISATFSRTAAGQTSTWSATGSGNWNTATNWTPNGVPSAGDNVDIVDSDNIARTITYNYIGIPINLGSVTVDLTGGSNFDTLSMSFNGPTNTALTANDEYVGYDGNGSVIQKPGQALSTNTVNNELDLGVEPGSVGSYAIGAGKLTVNGSAFLGGSSAGVGGTGSLALSGIGSVNTSGTLKVFANPGDELSISGGTLTAGVLDLSGNTGALNWTSGTLNLTNTNLAFDPTVSGTPDAPFNAEFTLAPSQTLGVSGSETVGGGGSASLTLDSGAANIVGTTLTIQANGAVNLIGGTLTAGSLSFDSNLGLFNWTNGTLNLTDENLTLDSTPIANFGSSFTLGNTQNLHDATTEIIGYSGNGAFNQTGGSNIVGSGSSGNLALAVNSGSTGNYILSGGTLTVNGNAYVGGSSSGAGGTATLTVGGSGQMTVTNTLQIYGSANNVINLTGGTITAGTLNFENNFGLFNWTSGSLSLTNETLVVDTGPNADFGSSFTLGSSQTLSTINQVVGDEGTGTFTQNGGASTITDELDLGRNTGGAGNYTLSAGTLTVNGSAFIGGSSGGVGGTGTLSVTGTGQLNVTNTLQIYNGSGNVINLNGGTINAGALNLSNSSQLNWISGTLKLAETLIIDSTSSANFGNSFTLGNGQNLTVNFEDLGAYGNGTFTQTGGTHTVIGELDFGRYPGSNGNYILSGGTLNAYVLCLGGYSSVAEGTGTLTVTGTGQLDVTSALDLQGGTNSVLNLDGGTITAPNINFLNEVNGAAVFNWTSGTLNTGDFDINELPYSGGNFTLTSSQTLSASYTEDVGDDSNGTFNQTGGSNTVHVELDVGRMSTGTYNLSAGMLTAGSENIGDDVGFSSTFVQTGGANIVPPSNFAGFLELGEIQNAAGVYSLQGGTVSSPVEEIGDYGTGTFNQSGGTNTVSTELDVAAQSGSTGAYNLISGTLVVGGSVYVGGASAGIYSGGAGGIGTFMVSGGVLTVANTLEVYPTTGTQFIMSGGNVTAASTINTATITQTGGTSNLGSLRGTGNLIIGNGSTLASMTLTAIQQNSVSVDSNGTLILIGGSASNIVDQLHISGSGIFNITNGHVFVDYGTGPDPIASIAAWIASGYAGGAWNGTGIMSITAQTNSGSYGIGYADSADPGNPANLASGMIEIMYTLLGDANLDGKVNGTDFNLMATNFNQAVTDGWDKGDFNYDGKVNGNDFVLLADNFNQFASQSDVSAADLAALDNFAAANGISLISIPEPASLAIVALAGLQTFRRRRRKT